MFAVNSLVKAAPLIKAAPQARQMTAIASNPLVRMSFTEKLIHGLVMTVSYCAVPAWILVNLRSYRGEGK